MYARKIKLSRKKSKSGKGGKGNGSNWGPRIALYEREKALAAQFPRPNASSSSSNGVNYNYNGHSHFQKPINHQGSYSDGSHRATTSSDSSHASESEKLTAFRKISAHYAALQEALLAGGNGGESTHPLTVIIPPTTDRLTGYGFKHRANTDSLPSTKTYRSEADLDLDFIDVQQEEVEVEMPPEMTMSQKDFGILRISTTEPQIHRRHSSSIPDSLNHDSSPEPVTLTMEDTLSDRETEKVLFSPRTEKITSKLKQVYIQSPQAHEFRGIQKNRHGGSKEIIVNESDYSATGRLELVVKGGPSPRPKMNGSEIAALAQGITMVYVPMESLPRRKPAAASVATDRMSNLDEFSRSQSRQDSTDMSCNFSNGTKDPDADSLLESFDSIIFKPKSITPQGKFRFSPAPSSSSSSRFRKKSSPVPAAISVNVRQSRRCSAVIPPPPPLPPKPYDNERPPIPPPLPAKQQQLTEAEKQRNLRKALDKLDEALYGKTTSNSPNPTVDKNNNSNNNNNNRNKDIKNNPNATNVPAHYDTCNNGPPRKITLTLPGENQPKEQEILIKYGPDHNYSCTILSCGHVMHDNYSTLSSINSDRISDDDEDETKTMDPRSALQQLRDLSLLIGGNFHEGEKLELPNDKKTRRDSNATDNSADSGQGSGSTNKSSPQCNLSSSSSSSSPNSNFSSNCPSRKASINSCISLGKKNPNCACGKAGCVFRPDCTECLMFNKKPFRKPDTSSELCNNSSDDGSGSLRGRLPILTNYSSKRHSKERRISNLSKSTGSSSSTRSSSKSKSKKPLILDYCDCGQCSDERASVSNLSSSARSSVSSGHLPAFQLHPSPTRRRGLIRGSTLRSKRSPRLSQSTSDTNGLFTIEEAEETYGEQHANNDISTENNRKNKEIHGDTTKGNHWHPQCWLAPDATMGWSDLESLYSQNLNSDRPICINDECWTCWKELSDAKHNGADSNRTVDRTKRMFIWLNRRNKEYNAPWWEAKKQASIRWLVTKASAHLPRSSLEDPFKDSKKAKPTRHRLKDEMIKGLISGKLYCMTLDNLYSKLQQQTPGGKQPYQSKQGLNHWDIIKILSRRGVYVASPSDMKLTEGTLRQRKPIRIAAHIALVEAIMGLYAKEILGRERIIATLKSFGRSIDPETSTSEQLVIAWINAAVMTLKSYIISNKTLSLTPEKLSRWLYGVPQIGEIRDLCDGVGICSLFALYCSSDLRVNDIAVPEPGENLTIYDSISNHTLVQKLCEDMFPETIYHLCITDFLYIHGYMKANILCFLVDLFQHFEISPMHRVNRLTHVPIRIEL